MLIEVITRIAHGFTLFYLLELRDIDFSELTASPKLKWIDCHVACFLELCG